MHPQEYYQSQLQIRRHEYSRLGKSVKNLSTIRLIVGLVLIAILYFAFRFSTQEFWLSTAGVFFMFLFFVRKHNRIKDQQKLVQISIDVLDTELKAVKEDYTSFLPGNQFVDVNHPYSYDLDIFGKGSIYQMLCRAVTQNGEKELAALLNDPYCNEDTFLQRQQDVKELSTKPDFLHQYRVDGISEEEESGGRDKIVSWLQMADSFINKKYLVFAAVVVPALAILFFTLSAVQQTFHRGLFLVIALNWLITLLHSKKVKEMHLLVGRSVKLIAKYERLLCTIASQQFESKNLRNIQANANEATGAITQLKKLAHLFDNRQNGMVGPFMNSFFLFDIYCVLRLEQWRSKNRVFLPVALDNVDKIDSYISLATYAFNNPENVYAAISVDGSINAEDLKHPLISRDVAVGNNVSLGKAEQFYLLTGANMTGKSTFIRTIGVNLILSYLGLPIRTKKLAVPLLRIYSAIRISDSVQDDLSYFKAELNRIQKLMSSVRASDVPYFVLLDEPLRGTNSADKQQGTRSLIEKLMHYNAIGIIATHDTALCDMVEIHKGKLSNYHFESRVQDGVLMFDFKLREGGSSSNNATILMKTMGII